MEQTECCLGGIRLSGVLRPKQVASVGAQTKSRAWPCGLAHRVPRASPMRAASGCLHLQFRIILHYVPDFQPRTMILLPGTRNILPTNMMQPTIAAPIAATRTAPAAQSLAFFASGWMFGEARSTTASTAVFRHSRDMTSAQQMTIAAHSRPSSPNHAPSTATATAAARWMRMFRSLFTVAAMPEIAYIKDRIIFPLVVRNTRERRIPPVRRRCV